MTLSISLSPFAGTITHSDLISGLVTEPHTGKLQQEGLEPTEQGHATPRQVLPGSEVRASDDHPDQRATTQHWSESRELILL